DFAPTRGAITAFLTALSPQTGQPIRPRACWSAKLSLLANHASNRWSPAVQQRSNTIMGSGRSDQRVELALRIERGEVVAAADMPSVDEDLRHGAAPVRACDHRVEARAIHRYVDFAEIGALAVEQHLGARAIGAEGLGIDFDLGHAAILSSFRPAYRNPTKQSQICCPSRHPARRAPRSTPTPARRRFAAAPAPRRAASPRSHEHRLSAPDAFPPRAPWHRSPARRRRRRSARAPCGPCRAAMRSI